MKNQTKGVAPKTKAAYAVKEDGIYKLHGKTYVKIRDVKELTVAKEWINKRTAAPKPIINPRASLQTSEVHNDEELLKWQEFANKLGNAKEARSIGYLHVIDKSTLQPETVSAATPSGPFQIVLNDMTTQNDRTIQAMIRLERLIDALSPSFQNEANKELQPRAGGLLGGMQYESSMHTNINNRLEEVVGVLEGMF